MAFCLLYIPKFYLIFIAQSLSEISGYVIDAFATNPLTAYRKMCILWNPPFLPTECVLLENSFVPLKHYYRNYMNTHNLKFNTCPVCGRVFVTNTLKKKFCSTGCTDIQGRITKAEYDERTRKDALESTYKKHYQFWHNRIVKAQNIPEFPADRLEKMKVEFEK